MAQPPGSGKDPAWKAGVESHDGKQCVQSKTRCFSLFSAEQSFQAKVQAGTEQHVCHQAALSCHPLLNARNDSSRAATFPTRQSLDELILLHPSYHSSKRSCSDRFPEFISWKDREGSSCVKSCRTWQDCVLRISGLHLSFSLFSWRSTMYFFLSVSLTAFYWKKMNVESNLQDMSHISGQGIRREKHSSSDKC